MSGLLFKNPPAVSSSRIPHGAGRLRGGAPGLGAQLESTEGQACPYAFQVSVGNKGRFAKLAFALLALLLENVPLALFPPDQLSCSGDFETLGNRLACLILS